MRPDSQHSPSVSPPGEFIAVGGRRIHVRLWGDWNAPSVALPIVLEAGLTMMTSCWGWLGPILGSRVPVLAYDRCGLGWSEAVAGPRSPEHLAAELALLLAQLRAGPWLFVGHSMAALILRALHRIHPELLAAAVLLDPVAPDRHPNRRFLTYLRLASRFASLGLPRLPMPFLRELDGLPNPDRAALRHFLRHPRHLRTAGREASDTFDFRHPIPPPNVPSLPGLQILASFPTPALPESSDVRSIPDSTHLSLLTRPHHARLVADAIARFRP